MLRCRDLSAASIYSNSRPFLLCGKRACALFLPRGGSRLFLDGEEDVLKFRELNLRWLSCLRARFAHNVKLVAIPTKKSVNLAKMCSEVREKQNIFCLT